MILLRLIKDASFTDVEIRKLIQTAEDLKANFR